MNGLRRVTAATAMGLVLVANVVESQSGRRWKAHDPDRPKPLQIDPGRNPGDAPSDAVALFTGKDLTEWVSRDGSAPKWVIRDGYLETVPGSGPIRTVRGFGDAQLHLEWATPEEAVGTGQGRGNSGVFMMGLYEVQVLDSYRNTTYADGQAGALYGQHPPLVNASRGPGEWQSYDIVFRRPRFAPGGALLKPARMTVFHNGVVIQDAAALWGPTNWLQPGRYAKHEDALPLSLQDHEHPVRYRNIWIRPLPDVPTDEAGLAESRPRLTVPAAVLDRYVGRYGTAESVAAEVTRSGGMLRLGIFGRRFPLVPETTTRFVFPRTAGTVEFGTRAGRPRIIVTVAEQVIDASRIP